MEKGRIATIPFSEGVLILFKIFNALQGTENKKEAISDFQYKNAPLEGFFLSQFQEELRRYEGLEYLLDRLNERP